MLHRCLLLACSFVLMMGLSDFASADYHTGFEVSEGFAVGGPMPAGWSTSGSGSVVVSGLNVIAGSQNLEIHDAFANYTAELNTVGSENFVIETMIRPSSYVAPEYNFGGYGWMYAYSQGYEDFAGGVLFRVQDTNDLSGVENPTSDELQILFWQSAGSQEVVGSFVPGAWYRYQIIIDSTNSTVTQRLEPLSGGVTIERVYARTITWIPLVVFAGDQYSFGEGSRAHFDEFSIGFEQPPEPVVVTPGIFDVTRGNYVGGSIAELSVSDNVDLTAIRRPTDIQSRVFLEVTSTSPAEVPSLFSFTVEAAVFARSEVSQSIDLFNYQLGSFEEVDVRPANRFTDLVTTVEAAGDLSRFVEPGTGEIKARVRFESANPRQQFSANIDQTVWGIRE